MANYHRSAKLIYSVTKFFIGGALLGGFVGKILECLDYNNELYEINTVVIPAFVKGIVTVLYYSESLIDYKNYENQIN